MKRPKAAFAIVFFRLILRQVFLQKIKSPIASRQCLARSCMLCALAISLRHATPLTNPPCEKDDEPVHQ